MNLEQLLFLFLIKMTLKKLESGFQNQVQLNYTHFSSLLIKNALIKNLKN